MNVSWMKLSGLIQLYVYGDDVTLFREKWVPWKGRHGVTRSECKYIAKCVMATYQNQKQCVNITKGNKLSGSNSGILWNSKKCLLFSVQKLFNKMNMNRVIFGPKGKVRILHKEDRCDLYWRLSIIRRVECRKLWWAAHVTGMRRWAIHIEFW
jgi:hypothetical protein